MIKFKCYYFRNTPGKDPGSHRHAEGQEQGGRPGLAHSGGALEVQQYWDSEGLCVW